MGAGVEKLADTVTKIANEDFTAKTETPLDQQNFWKCLQQNFTSIHKHFEIAEKQMKKLRTETQNKYKDSKCREATVKRNLEKLKTETRLISIVSKPILVVVVVVVIDVAFVKKMLGPKKILFKKIHVQKNFRKKNFGSKRVRSKKIVVQKNVVQKIKVQKNFGSKKILGPRNFG